MNVSKYCNEPGPGIPASAEAGVGKRRRRPLTPWVISGIILFFLLATAGLILLPIAGTPAPHTAYVKLKPGATEEDVVAQLRQSMDEEYADAVAKVLPIVNGGEKLRHGAWLVKQGMTPFQTARLISKGGQSGIRLTLQGQRTPEQVAAKIAETLDIPADSMLTALNDRKLLRQYRTDPEHVLGLFLADTYELYWTSTPQDVLQKMHSNYERFWTPERITQAEALRLTPREVVIISSIVDEETNQQSEKGTIGRLYLNRLHKGMKLQADPTVKYSLGDFSIQRITSDMLKTDSPYNTYMYEGLPPGPIRIPSGTTIDAVLHSRPHGYLYMCAAEDFSGRHNFSVDYDTHLANARRYQQALDQRGIK